MIRKSAILLCVLYCLLFSACDIHNHTYGVNNGDWEYELTNEYVIWHINSQNIVCGKKKSEHSISNVTDDFVKSFSYDEQHIFLQCIANKQSSNEQTKYYVVKVQSDEIIGPLSETEYDEYVTDHDIMSPHWIDTRPTPQEFTKIMEF